MAAKPDFLSRGAFAATRARSRWVLFDGCPVVSVHLCFGLALQTGQGTDKIRFCVSCPVSTPTVSTIANSGDGQFCSLGCSLLKDRPCETLLLAWLHAVRVCAS